MAGSGESPFCPHCGAPQLYLSLDYQSPETGGEVPPGADNGAMPLSRPNQVEWKTAILCAASVAGAAGLLNVIGERFPVALPFGSLCTLSGSLIVLGLYQRRWPLARMNAGIGARIGIVVGLAMAICLAASIGIGGLFAHYILHRTPSFVATTAPMIEQIQQNAANASAPEWMRHITPEVRAGLLLCAVAMSSFIVLVLSALGGAFAGLLRTRRKPAV
jgi:hypothetical protein